MPIEIRELVIRTTIINDETLREHDHVNMEALKREMLVMCKDEFKKLIVHRQQR